MAAGPPGITPTFQAGTGEREEQQVAKISLPFNQENHLCSTYISFTTTMSRAYPSCEEAWSFCWTRGCPEEKQNCIRRARRIGVLWVPTTVCHPAPQHDTLHGCLNASLWKQRGPQPRQRLNDCLAKTSQREFKQQKEIERALALSSLRALGVSPTPLIRLVYKFGLMQKIL